MPTEHYGMCPICGATCGLTVEMSRGEIMKIRGDDKYPLSKGYICPKGAALKELHEMRSLSVDFRSFSFFSCLLF